MNVYLLFFIVSGFCSLVYQITWLRVAMAQFGMTTPSVSIVLSVFMAGLAIGTWGAGKIANRLASAGAGTFMRLYGISEAIIGISGFVVSLLLQLGHDLLAGAGNATWGSLSYYLASASLITLALLPFCICMGATLPFAMAAVRAAFPDTSKTSFSFLYVANVLGALAGCLGSAFVLIEFFGFRKTMLIAAALNLLIALAAFLISGRFAGTGQGVGSATAVAPPPPLQGGQRKLLLLLFLTGLSSLAMEVIWVRLFVPYQGPVVYTFAVILALYFICTLIGSHVYRFRYKYHPAFTQGNGYRLLALLAAVAGLMPVLMADYRLTLPSGILIDAPMLLPLSRNSNLAGIVRVALGIGPFSAILGFLTPAVIDRVSGGEPGRAGSAYALNMLGCIVGPLIAGFLLLPFCGERWSLIFLSLPLFVLGLFPSGKEEADISSSFSPGYLRNAAVAVGVISFLMVTLTRDYDRSFPNAQVLRDHTATVIAAGSGFKKQLLVNGVGITSLTSVTKMMVHLPSVSLVRPPAKGLVLCLGMGTSFRSMLSWGIDTTVVELVPSIPSLLPFFHADGEKVLRAPNGRIVVDDARRFLERSTDIFDVIVVDPPPPLEAASSSLLYSVEFYRSVAKRLSPHGIFQQWIPGGDTYVMSSMAKTVEGAFPYVRTFLVPRWGVHVLASMNPIPPRNPEQMAMLLPASAAADLVEWGFEKELGLVQNASPQAIFATILKHEVSTQRLREMVAGAPLLSDDRPLNEYYLLRRYLNY
jgi:predicted membrane-bound spermidine synthase